MATDTLKTATRTDLLQAAIACVLEQHRAALDRNMFLEQLRIEVKFKNGAIHPVKVGLVGTAEHWLTFEEGEPFITQKG